MPPPIPSQKPKSVRSRKAVFKATFAYRASNEDELSFEEGQIVYFIEEVEDGWAKGELEDGTTGLYPTNFVEVSLRR